KGTALFPFLSRPRRDLHFPPASYAPPRWWSSPSGLTFIGATPGEPGLAKDWKDDAHLRVKPEGMLFLPTSPNARVHLAHRGAMPKIIIKENGRGISLCRKQHKRGGEEQK